MIEENKILDLYFKNMNSKDIAIELNISRHTVYRILKKHNLKSNNNKPFNPRNFTDEEVELMITLYKKGYTCEEIYNNFFKEKCTSEKAIQGLLSRRINLRHRGKRIDFDENFFENIDNERKAYWLGFIYADGNVTNNRLRIEIQRSDAYLLNELNKDLGSNNKVCECKDTHSYKGYLINKDNVYIGYCSDKMIKDLNKWGCVPNKTFKINKIPNIKPNLLRHFIRGYFDGDGTVYNDNKNHKDNRSIFGFYGQYDFLKDIKQYLIREINIANRKITDKGTVSFVTFSKKIDILRFYDYIYKDASIYLIRKKDKFDKYLR